MGYIYKVSNDVNNKVYIGQTIYPIEDRFKRHIYAALNGTQEYKFQKAILALGVEHFTINIIEDINDSEMNDREIYWIAFYDSYKNGYNSTLGGSGHRRIDGKIEEEVVKLRLQGTPIREIATIVGLSLNPIESILKKNNLGTQLVKDQEICRLKEEGLNSRDISRILNCSEQTVIRALCRNDKEELLQKNKRVQLKEQAVKLRKQGYTLQRIADELHLSRKTIGKYLKELMPEQVRKSPGSYDNDVQRMLLEGKSAKEIRKLLGCSDNVIKRNKSLLFDKV